MSINMTEYVSEWAYPPFPPNYPFPQQILIQAVSSRTFITIVPLVSKWLGAYFSCKSVLYVERLLVGELERSQAALLQFVQVQYHFILREKMCANG